MRRIWGTLFFFAALSLGACGGGGSGSAGGGPVGPPTPIGNPSPGHSPSSSPSSKPSTGPSSNPSGSPSGNPSSRPSESPAPSPTPYAQAIQHIIIIIQENRSFDNLFGGPNPFPGADGASSGTMSTGQIVPLAPVGLESLEDLIHSHVNFERQYAFGKMYFDLGDPGHPTYPYSYVPYTETQPYWSMASQYVLADRMFESNNGPSYTAHQYLIAGQSQNADENPNLQPTQDPLFNGWGCDDPPGTLVSILVNGQDTPGVFPCFDYQTIADELDAAGLTWKYYAPTVGGGNFGAVWSAFDAIRHIRYGQDWINRVISPEQQVLTDAQQPLPSVTWVVPSIGDSDHSGTGSKTGPSWVSSVVNAVGSGPNWKTSAIFIIWDDWGGWYDHVPPAQIDPMGLGFRVPMIVVSPYAKHGYVSHVPYEFGSLLRFIEDRYGLARLGASDSRANPVDDVFNFSQPPRTFTPIQSEWPKSYFLHEPPSNRPPDND